MEARAMEAHALMAMQKDQQNIELILLKHEAERTRQQIADVQRRAEKVVAASAAATARAMADGPCPPSC